MQTVVETPGYLAAAKAAGISNVIRAEIVSVVAANPGIGDLIVGSGGLRKFRFARQGAGKSGGFRILSYFNSSELPVFLIGAFAKSERANLTRAETNQIAARLKAMASEYARRGRT